MSWTISLLLVRPPSIYDHLLGFLLRQLPPERLWTMLRLRSSSDDILKLILIPSLVNLFTSTVTYFFTNSLFLMILVLVAGFTLFFVFYYLVDLLLRRRLALIAVSDFIPYNRNHRPTEIISLNDRLQGLENRFMFMGVSAKSIWNTDLVRMMTDNSYQKCSFWFLLLDPTGNALARRMAEEQVTTEAAARLDIEAFVRQLSEMKQLAPRMDIRVHYFDFVPPFWLMLCDDTLYVQTFPRGGIGLDSPLLVMKQEAKGKRGFFEPFVILLEDTWNYNSKEAVLA